MVETQNYGIDGIFRILAITILQHTSRALKAEVDVALCRRMKTVMSESHWTIGSRGAPRNVSPDCNIAQFLFVEVSICLSYFHLVSSCTTAALDSRVNLYCKNTRCSAACRWPQYANAVDNDHKFFFQQFSHRPAATCTYSNYATTSLHLIE